MELEEPAVALYDYLYKDSARISSYYAQLFSGRLSSLEETDTDSSGVDRGAKLDAHLVGGDIKHTSSRQKTSKRIVDPHDLITTEVLSYFTENDVIAESILEGTHGQLVITKGTLGFVDKSMIEIGTITFKMSAETLMSKVNKTAADRAELEQMKVLIALLEKVQIPSAFQLNINGNFIVVGTIKDDGMQEPISSYYYKYGTSGLSDVYLIGIKEIPTPSLAMPSTPLLVASQGAAEALSTLLFHEDAIRVTPIAMFRRLF
ncbi:hypothetical protein CCAX7_000730 [Capsulimonas corticalis]|uniref:Uncharacterized protein n=1 Tax=Capsulimonas corticalis TaxID=2219043 RepID=A0A402CRM1_9BACT|nr:hypothetical protein [Capsulimonas corticalis]BDI28022.1 hypothetical protein CCAX7_000730 [Capsulimonas corticalis]